MTNSTPTRLLIPEENHGHLRGWVVEIEPGRRDRGPDAQRGHERARRSGSGRGGAETVGGAGSKRRTDRRTGLRRNLSNATGRPTGRGSRGRPSRPSRPPEPPSRVELGGTERLSPELRASTPPCLRHSSKGSSAVRSRPSSNRARQTPKKITDFKLALANGDCTWDLLPLSKSVHPHRATPEAEPIAQPRTAHENRPLRY
jgi:hypothetical protein